MSNTILQLGDPCHVTSSLRLGVTQASKSVITPRWLGSCAC